MLPETLRLAEYGLGHDDRAHEQQPVAIRFGPSFHSWQLEGSVEESWEECMRHAALIKAVRSNGSSSGETEEVIASTDLLGQPLEADLFGNEVVSKKRRKKP
jgi:hypothetical protein